MNHLPSSWGMIPQTLRGLWVAEEEKLGPPGLPSSAVSRLCGLEKSSSHSDLQLPGLHGGGSGSGGIRGDGCVKERGHMQTRSVEGSRASPGPTVHAGAFVWAVLLRVVPPGGWRACLLPWRRRGGAGVAPRVGDTGLHRPTVKSTAGGRGGGSLGRGQVNIEPESFVKAKPGKPSPRSPQSLHSQSRAGKNNNYELCY